MRSLVSLCPLCLLIIPSLTLWFSRSLRLSVSRSLRLSPALSLVARWCVGPSVTLFLTCSVSWPHRY
ncbi:hypothetical protein EDD21DRAFT_393391 [Dissophora ornata]|nr:hypothetical protein EDD21DRAFT_393391 [Dissophora ornata]